MSDRKKNDLRLLLRLGRYAIPYWRSLALALVLVSIYSAGVASRAFIGKLLFDDVLTERGSSLEAREATEVRVEAPEVRPPEGDLRDLLPEGFRGREARVARRGTVTIRKDGQTIGPLQFAEVTVEADAFEATNDGFRATGHVSVAATLPAASAAAPDWEALKLLFVFGLAVSLVIPTAHYFRERVTYLLEARVVADIRVATSEHLIRQPLALFHERRQGELLSRFTNDIQMMRQSVRLLFGDVFQWPVVLVASVAAAIYISWQLSFVLFLVLPAVMIPIARLGKKLRRAARKTLENAADLTTLTQQAASGIRDVKAFHLEEACDEQYRKQNERYLEITRKWVGAKALTVSIIELVYNGGSVLLLILGAYVISAGLTDLTTGDLVAFGAVIVQMYMPAKGLAKAYEVLQETLAGAARVFEIHDLPGEPPDPPDAIRMVAPRKGIAFEDVHFAYREGEEVLRGVTFFAPAGKVTAIVGPTGAGKSTIANLLLRFYRPTSGTVAIDGVDIGRISRESLSLNMALVSQDPFLFHLSIRENIALGRLGASMDDIVRAARAAHIDEEIRSFEKGYETAVGDRGAKLSGGQRQRVTIARAILRNAPILVLDEATSSLDAAKEQAVKAALDALIAERTTIVIAHRLSTVKDADQILVLEEGRVAERGTHDELMARGGLYASLYGLQVTEPGNGGAEGGDEEPAAAEAVAEPLGAEDDEIDG